MLIQWRNSTVRVEFAAAAQLFSTSKGQEQFLVRKFHNSTDLFLKPLDFFFPHYFFFSVQNGLVSDSLKH